MPADEKALMLGNLNTAFTANSAVAAANNQNAAALAQDIAAAGADMKADLVPKTVSDDDGDTEQNMTPTEKVAAKAVVWAGIIKADCAP